MKKAFLFVALALTLSACNDVEVIVENPQMEYYPVEEFKPTAKDIEFVRNTYNDICDIYPEQMPKCEDENDFWFMYNAIWFAYHNIKSFADTYMEGDGWDNFMKFVEDNNIEL